MTHQDCLQSWLQVQRGDGRCELCKTKFRFAPKYADNTPDRLPVPHVVFGLVRRGFYKWLPLLLRILLAASLWLLIAPLLTAYLYHCWMARPNVIFTRMWIGKLVITDLISGAVVAACIIVSFLSLMSFADFLRLEWQQQGLMGAAARRERRLEHNNNNNHNQNVNPNFIPQDADVDNGIWDHLQQEVLQRPAARATDRRLRRLAALEINENDSRDFSNMANNNHYNVDNDDEDDDEDDESWHEEDDSDSNETSSEDNDDELEHEDPPHVIDPRVADDLERILQRQANNVVPPPRPRQIQRNDGRMDQLPAFDVDQDDPIDMDINIALDELLGVRGPLLAVGRNLLWLLAFNAVYLGFFAFVPRTVGAAIGSIFFNTTMSQNFSMSDDENATEVIAFNFTEKFSVVNLWQAIDAESSRQSAAFRLHDVATVLLGYLTLACAVIFFRFMWFLSHKVRFFRNAHTRIGNHDFDDVQEAIDEVNRLVHAFGHDGAPVAEEPHGVALGLAVGIALDAMISIVKVGVLLFLKMFMLPIVLGLALDASTISLFGSTLDERVTYAGRDLFSFIMLHWVAGITFMLIVTVSVLQLREVAHPELLAQMIRPQEPQPDLLGNLMHESVATHTKRMVLSLIIYAFLLTVHVYLPLQFMLSRFVGDSLKPHLKLRFWYIFTPQLQVPLELLIFHLCMLALLEKYKNAIGGMQHIWLKFMSGVMGLTDRILPENVGGFRLLGSRPVFKVGHEVDQFWYELANSNKDPLEILTANLHTFVPASARALSTGETKSNGERVLRFGSDFIRLPIRLPGKFLRSRSVLLPTRIGKFRLKRDAFNSINPVIQIWEEVPGEPIQRPPAGWDDLGAGGADVQGRWAWGSEKKSIIEEGVASRRPFFELDQSFIDSVLVMVKLLLIGFLSWLACTALLGIALTVPLTVGRAFYTIFRIPDRWVHDPLAFGLGFGIVFPFVDKATRLIMAGELSMSERLLSWLQQIYIPPRRKFLVMLEATFLWTCVAPFLLGLVYELVFLKSDAWFKGDEPLFDLKSLLLSSLSGFIILDIWASLCVLGVFTRKFRGMIVIGDEDNALVRNLDNEQQGEDDLGANNEPTSLSWQGANGRLARFTDTFRAVVVKWEWDRVDEVVLLEECTRPILHALLTTVLVPLVFVSAFGCAFSDSSGRIRAVLTRLTLFLVCSLQIGIAWKDQLWELVEVAHKTARDDRYLIGEILLNFGEE